MAKDIKCHFKTSGTEANPVKSITEAAFLIANKEVKNAAKKLKISGGKLRTYSTFSAKEKAKIAKCVIFVYATRQIKRFNSHLHSYSILIITCLL